MRITADGARAIVNAAYKARRAAGSPLESALCPIDAAAKLGVEVRFESLATLEGLYFPDPKLPVILLGSDRPRGRQAFTCAHELGHYILGHRGSRMDAIRAGRACEGAAVGEEAEANVFAGHFLAPLPAIERALKIRGLGLDSMMAADFYALGCLFGMGYTAILTHLRYSLRRIDDRRYEELGRASPQEIVRSLVGGKDADLLVVDASWSGHAIDLRVGAAALLPPGTELEGRCVEASAAPGRSVLARAVRPGVGLSFRRTDGWSSCVRVSPSLFKGRAVWRHMEADDDQ